MKKPFIPPHALDAHFRESLKRGDAEKAEIFRTMLSEHETGPARIERALSEYKLLNVSSTSTVTT